jgi:hypothetical protein
MGQSCSHGKVVDLDRYRRARKRKRRQSPRVDPQDMDEAMRNLHAAASAALKLVAIARNQMGLPQL